jgi:hypothetical protein
MATEKMASPAHPALPQVAARPVQAGISAQALASRIDSFLASRGYRPPESSPPPPRGAETPSRADNPPDFICEDDVRAALRSGRKLIVGEKTIVTPSARDLGESEHVFVQSSWPS